MAILAALIAITSLRYFILAPEIAAPPPLLAMVMNRNTIFLLHAAGGIVALVAGAWNLLEPARNRWLSLHRWVGRVYLVAVFGGGISGLLLSTTAQGGLAGKFGFGMLALLWLVTGAFAYIRIRAYDIEAHRRWMIRNYALTFAAVTLRLWLPGMAIAGYEFAESYGAIAWLAWVPNLIVAEVIIGNRR